MPINDVAIKANQAKQFVHSSSILHFIHPYYLVSKNDIKGVVYIQTEITNPSPSVKYLFDYNVR